MPVMGLKFCVQPQELRDHCRSRAAYHSERSKHWVDKLPELQTALDEAQKLYNQFFEPSAPTNTSGWINKSNLDMAIGNLQRGKDSATSHAKSAAQFQFFTDHLYKDVYELSESDLSRLEFIRDMKIDEIIMHIKKG